MILSFTCNGLTRRLQRVENAVVAVRQDSAVDTVRMIFRPEEFNNISLATVSVKFLYVDNTNGEIKAYQTGTTPDGGVYVADWELTDDVVDDAGYINFAVKLAVVNGDAVEKQWFSIPDTFRVYDSVDDTNNPPGETAAEQATNAEKIAQLQSQLGTATSELSSLTSTVALQGAQIEAVRDNALMSRGDLSKTAVPDLTTFLSLNTGLYRVANAAWVTAEFLPEGYGILEVVKSGGSYAYMRLTTGAGVVYERTFNADTKAWIATGWEKKPARAEMDAVSTVETITAEVNTDEVAPTGWSIVIKKVGNVVSVNGYAVLANPTKTNAAITLATLPQNVRPSVTIRATAAVAAHAYEQPEGMCYAGVGTNGVLNVRLQTGNSAKNNVVYMSISYII